MSVVWSDDRGGGLSMKTFPLISQSPCMSDSLVKTNKQTNKNLGAGNYHVRVRAWFKF